MMNTFKAYLWNNKIGRYIMSGFSYIKNYLAYQLFFHFGTTFRKCGWSNHDYKKINDYKNRYHGNRCFIIATGPSLTLQDVSRLKNEYTFGMNSICLLFDKLGWETTFYGVQDTGVYLKLREYYKNFKKTTLLLGDGLPLKGANVPNHIPFTINYLDHKHSYKRLNTKFSLDASKYVYDGYTITYSLIQIAVFMGFKEIYLLGNDCSYPKDPTKQHFADFGHIDPSTLTARDRILFAYQYAKDYLENTDVKIYNATRGGALEIFPRVDFDDINFK